MARGLMVSYMAAHQVETKEEIKKFAEDGYWFEESNFHRGRVCICEKKGLTNENISNWF
mgnify:CR=1 FL=1